MEMQTAVPVAHTLGVTSLADAHVSGVSWGAVLAGAVAATALSLILLILGFGLGLSAVSPWSYNVAVIGTSTIAWIAFTQLAGSGIGGYLAGRLRVKWASVHSDEVYFRDTAHGFLAWSVASLFTVALLAGVVRVLLGGALDVGVGTSRASNPAAIAGTVAGTINSGSAAQGNPIDYFSDILLRTDQAHGFPDGASVATRNEVTKIFATDMDAGKLAAEDRDYLARMVAQRTGLSQADAENKVDGIYSRAVQFTYDSKEKLKQAANAARKAAAHSALWMFISLLFGAFVASLSATLGGHQRDKEEVYIRR